MLTGCGCTETGFSWSDIEKVFDDPYGTAKDLAEAEKAKYAKRIEQQRAHQAALQANFDAGIPVAPKAPAIRSGISTRMAFVALALGGLVLIAARG